MKEEYHLPGGAPSEIPSDGCLFNLLLLQPASLVWE
jgi:hypothetical protein